MALFLAFGMNLRELQAIVGEEEISPSKIKEIKLEQEKMIEEEQKTKEEDERAYLMKTLEEKRKKAAAGSPEEKVLAEELLKLRREMLLKKKRWQERVRLKPYERFVFDSNIQNSRTAKSDIIFDTGTDIQLDLGTRRTRLDVNGTVAYEKYLHNSKLSRFENRLGVDGSYPISSKSQVDASYLIYSTGDQNSEIRSIVERLRQEAALIFRQRVSEKTAVRIAQTYSDVFFYKQANREDSSRQYVLSPELNYFFSKKTSAFARYAFGLSGGGQNGSNEAIANEIRGGIRGKIAPKTTALADFGYSLQSKKKPKGNQNAFVAEMIVISNITRKSQIEFLMNRNFSQAVATSGSSYYITDNFRLTGSTQFRRFLYGDLSAGLRRNTFEQEGKVSGSDQHDLIVELSSSLRYDFRKWLGFELRYLFSCAASNESSREYAKNLFSFAINGRY